MHTSSLLASLLLSTLALSDNTNHEAPLIQDQPLGAAYIATLPSRHDTTIRGNITAVTSPDKSSIIFAVAIEGLPTDSSLRPFPYHIHAFPVPSDGNCTSTLAHLDPYGRGETPPCDPSSPWTCQVGDLSGKHGKLTPSNESDVGVFTASYEEYFVDANPGRGSFFGNRSITVHFANKTRITCANFTEISGGGLIGALPLGEVSSAPVSGASAAATASPFPPIGAANGTATTMSESATGAKTTGSRTTSSTPEQFTGGAGRSGLTIEVLLGAALGVVALAA